MDGVPLEVLDKVLAMAAGGYLACEDSSLPSFPIASCSLGVRSVCKLWGHRADSIFECWARGMVDQLQATGRLQWLEIARQPPHGAKELFFCFVWKRVPSMQHCYVSAFHCACTYGLSRVVNMMLRTFKDRMSADDLETGYRLAAENCKFDTIELFYHPDVLFSKGFNVLRADLPAAMLHNYASEHESLQSMYDSAEETPASTSVVLMIAAAYGDVEKVVEVARDGRSSRFADMYFRCALKWATRRMSRRMLDALVDSFL